MINLTKRNFNSLSLSSRSHLLSQFLAGLRQHARRKTFPASFAGDLTSEIQYRFYALSGFSCLDICKSYEKGFWESSIVW
ncbi:hypothetical protein Pyn_17781 [Prunus yedoensis var. nudiflora]|uniref:Uncharacterized protein n=1 Tax=Prunus yedoensis var. nudiflora TaxID=2094558 RepID=A0A314Y1K6_PRUYE|nr:hypothetical protein Pyn_17781 [Prunus yedoensis var. nudiflora]